MFDNTGAIITKTKKDILLLFSFFTFSTQIFYILYQIFALCTSDKFWYAHLILLIASTSYFLFFIAITNMKVEIPKGLNRRRKKELKKIKKEINERKKFVKKIYKYVKYVINGCTLSISMYTIIVYPNAVHPLSILFTTFLFVLLILQILLEIVSAVIMARLEMFRIAFKDDISSVLKPIETVKNIFKRNNSDDSNNGTSYQEKDPETTGAKNTTRDVLGSVASIVKFGVEKFTNKSKNQVNSSSRTDTVEEEETV